VRLATEASVFMSIGTKSVLFGAHCFFLHPLFVALAWTRLYGFPRDWRLYLAFFVHDLGYAGKENIDGPEGEEHVHFGAAVMRRLCGREWEEFTRSHSRYWAKKTGRPYSRLCVADKLAFVLTPLWLYIPMTRWTGELAEYMRRARFSLDDIRNLESWEARCLQSEDEHSFLVGLRSYTNRWVEHHRDLAEDHWTIARDWTRAEESNAEVLR